MVTINSLSFGYKKNNLLFDKLNLELLPGQIYGLLGLNGTGKTTLLKHIAGLLHPKSGSCLVNGKPSVKRLPETLQEIFLIPEEFELPAIKGKEFIKLHAPFYPLFNHGAFSGYLEILELDTNKKLTDFSFGQKKKFIIAFGLATNCKLLILDEPTNGLDIPSKSKFRKLIASVPIEDRCIVISTHQVRDLSALIDHVIILESGEIIFRQSINDIMEKLSFEKVTNMEDENILYTEDTIGGGYAICKKTHRETSPDMELLFNGIIHESKKINAVFKTDNNEK